MDKGGKEGKRVLWPHAEWHNHLQHVTTEVTPEFKSVYNSTERDRYITHIFVTKLITI